MNVVVLHPTLTKRKREGLSLYIFVAGIHTKIRSDFECFIYII